MTSKTVLGVAALAAAAVAPSLAFAQQPLPITVNPFAVPGQVVNTAIGLPGQIISDPLNTPRAILGVPLGILGVDTTGPVINEQAAKRAAVNDPSKNGEAVVSTDALPTIGPRYQSPNPNLQPVVLSVGSYVPTYVKLAPATNVSVRGLAPDARYNYFVTQQNRVVFVDPATRTVVRIVRA